MLYLILQNYLVRYAVKSGIILKMLEDKVEFKWRYANDKFTLLSTFLEVVFVIMWVGV